MKWRRRIDHAYGRFRAFWVAADDREPEQWGLEIEKRWYAPLEGAEEVDALISVLQDLRFRVGAAKHELAGPAAPAAEGHDG